MDSAGIGELVEAYTSVKTKRGELKLLNSTKRVYALLKLSQLLTVFEVYTDEPSALRSFG
jgi:anti-sigma B factor antagonist